MKHVWYWTKKIFGFVLITLSIPGYIQGMSGWSNWLGRFIRSVESSLLQDASYQITYLPYAFLCVGLLLLVPWNLLFRSLGSLYFNAISPRQSISTQRRILSSIALGLIYISTIIISYYSYQYAVWVSISILTIPMAAIGAVIRQLLLDRFISLKSTIQYATRMLISDESWIEEFGALDLIQQSKWARSRYAQNEPNIPIQDAWFVGGRPSKSSRQKMFRDWCELCLGKFAEKDDTTRIVESKKEYNESKLREWLDERYDSELLNEFGHPA